MVDLPEEGQAALWRLVLWRLVALVRGMLACELRPDGFNVGVNDGPPSLTGRGAQATPVRAHLTLQK
jgi:hypothetical protein